MAYVKTNWENGVTPINAINLNNIENGIESNDESITTLSERDNYSTDEQLVGKWVDGSNLYRRVYSKSATYSSTTVTLGTLDTNCRVRFATAVFYNTGNANEYIMSNASSSIIHDGNNLNINTTAGWGVGEVDCVVYYTK
jgi:hypothetical protein